MDEARRSSSKSGCQGVDLIGHRVTLEVEDMGVHRAKASQHPNRNIEMIATLITTILGVHMVGSSSRVGITTDALVAQARTERAEVCSRVSLAGKPCSITRLVGVEVGRVERIGSQASGKLGSSLRFRRNMSSRREILGDRRGRKLGIWSLLSQVLSNQGRNHLQPRREL